MDGRKRRRYKGQAAKAAMMLFGNKPRQKMERPEQRQAMALAYRMSSEPKFRLLASRALDPIYRHTSFCMLAEQLGLNYHMMSDEYKALQKSKGLIAMADQLPTIMEQTATAATDRLEVCKKCQGEKLLTSYDYEAIEKARTTVGEDTRLERPSDPRIVLLAEGKVHCPACGGEGEVFVAGDPDKLKMVFETFALTGQKGLTVNNNLDLRNTSVPEEMQDLAASVAPIIEGTVKQ